MIQVLIYSFHLLLVFVGLSGKYVILILLFFCVSGIFLMLSGNHNFPASNTLYPQSLEKQWVGVSL